jgi:DNA-binding CsgD family transcriptional regulator
MRCSITDIGRQLYLEPDKRQEWMEFVDRQDYGRFEVRIRDKKGDIGWICLSARPVRDIEGKTIYYEGFAEDITLRKKAEEELMQYRCHLEEMVEERTLQLEKRNQQLISEIAEREKVEKALLESERELRSKAQNLMEVNTTMDVLLRTMEKDQEELKESFLANITEQVLPYLDKLKKTPLNNVQQGFIRMVESSLNEIASPFVRRLTSSYLNLTKKEIQVAAMIKEGRTTKEIADLMDSSLRVIEFHRENIRKKLGIKNKKGNLQILLRSFS